MKNLDDYAVRSALKLGEVAGEVERLRKTVHNNECSEGVGVIQQQAVPAQDVPVPDQGEGGDHIGPV